LSSGHGFSRAATSAISKRLQPLRDLFQKPFGSGSNSKAPSSRTLGFLERNAAIRASQRQLQPEGRDFSPAVKNALIVLPFARLTRTLAPVPNQEHLK
jgi:hypothetical protein